ncbi:MAG: 50S ribosomal protein L30 [Deinococcales bacterium]
MNSASTMTLTLKRSLIKLTKPQLSAAKSLGLKKIGQTVTVDDSPATRGQVEAIKFILEIS